MNAMNVLIRFQLLIIINLLAITSYAQDKTDSKSLILTAIEKKQFTFLAQSVTPMKVGTRQLTPGYTLRISGDTLTCNLPYFGRVYQPSLSTTDGGLNFTSYQFDYQTKVRKKGGWDIRIKTKDLTSQRQFFITVQENGNVNVSVTCNDRESISYYGSLSFGQNEH